MHPEALRFARATRGASFIEYIIVVGVIALGAVVAYRAFGRDVSSKMVAAADNVRTLTPMTGAPGVDPSAPPPIAGDVCTRDGKCGPGESNCFVAGTRVATPNGAIAIESIHPGDVVFATDPEAPAPVGMAQAIHLGASLLTLPPSIAPMGARTSELTLPLAFSSPSTDRHVVTRTFVRTATSLVTLRTEHGIVRTTLEHPFMTARNGWTAAKDLTRGDRLVTRDRGRTSRVVDVQIASVPPMPVYNFTVADVHTYAVGLEELVVHNFCGPNSIPDTYGTFGPLRPGGETKFSPNSTDPAKQCITPDELQQLTQEDAAYTAGYTNIDPSGVSQNDWTQTNAQRPSSCSTVLCDSSNGMCFSGQAGRPFGPSNSDQGGNPQVCAEALENYLQSFPPPRPQNWGSLNCAEKRALLQWMDYRRSQGQSIDPRGKGLFTYSVAPDEPGCPDKAACRNCQTHMPALGIYSASDARDPRTRRMNNGVPRPPGLCP